MMSVKEKFEKWSDKVMTGARDCFAITRNEGGWYIVSSNHAEQILSLRIAIDEGNGLRSEYEYSVHKQEPDQMNFTIIVKDDNKMIVQIGDEEKAFGLKDCPYPVNLIVIHCKTAGVNTFLFGSRQSGMINTTYAPVWSAEDAVDHCMEGFFRELKSVSTDAEMAGSEVKFDDEQ